MDKLKSLLSDKWSEVLEGLQEGMAFTTTDLSKINSEPFHNVDIDTMFAILIENKQYDQLGKYCDFCQEDHNHFDEIESIVWENFGTGNYRKRSKFLCKMQNERYGFFIASKGSCGYNSCPVGGSYAYFYIGTFDEIYTLAMTDKDRAYHNNKQS